jgi:hypothetical protein
MVRIMVTQFVRDGKSATVSTSERKVTIKPLSQNKIVTTVSTNECKVTIEPSGRNGTVNSIQRECIITCVKGILELSPESIGALAKEFENMRNPSPPDDANPQVLGDLDVFLEQITDSIDISDEEHKSRVKANLDRNLGRRDELLQGAMSAPEVAKLLRTSRQTPHDRVKSRSLLSIKDKGKWLFPVWQFDEEGSDRVVEGLPEVLRILSANSAMSTYAQMSWLKRPNKRLGGLEPINALKSGKLDAVVREARYAVTY